MQRCIAHKMRNVAIKLRKHNQKPATGGAKQIFAAPNRKEALRRFKAWRSKWIIEVERAVRCLEKGLYNCLHYYDIPEEMWEKIRTTNVLERAFREVRQRTNPMGIFPNAASANRIFYGTINYMNGNWRGSHLSEISAELLT